MKTEITFIGLNFATFDFLKDNIPEKIDKNKLGREKFIEKVWEWKEEHGDIILNQLKKLKKICKNYAVEFISLQKYKISC